MKLPTGTPAETFAEDVDYLIRQHIKQGEEQRCQNCQTWTPVVFGGFALSRYCPRCVEMFQEQGRWCIQHGPTFGSCIIGTHFKKEVQMSNNTARFLGDGVYAEMETGGRIILTTQDGISITNRIVLEFEVFTALIEWVGDQA